MKFQSMKDEETESHLREKIPCKRRQVHPQQTAQQQQCNPRERSKLFKVLRKMSTFNYVPS